LVNIRLQEALELRVSCREELGAVIETVCLDSARRHAPAGPARFLKHGDLG